MREKLGCVHFLEIFFNPVFICVYFSLVLKGRIGQNAFILLHQFTYSYFWPIQDPTLISNVSGYEPYERIKAIRGSIMWPQNYSIPHDSSDNGAVLGYVRKNEE